MISFFNKLNRVEVQIIGAEIPEILNSLCDDNVSLIGTKPIDEYEVSLFVYKKDFHVLQKTVNKYGGEVVSVNKPFLKSVFQSMKRHSAFLGVFLLLVILFYILPLRIYFIKVQGNQNIDSVQILSACRSEGLYPGVKRRDIRSEQIKNSLIAEFPQIIWAGVNTHGSCAVVSIKENLSDSIQKQPIPCDIVAASDGKIQRIEVIEGEAKYRAGDDVEEGEILISGQMDVGLCTLNKAAAGEIYAETFRSISSVIPKTIKSREVRKQIKHRITLHYQNNKIKLCFSSGISDATCGRISREYFLTFPGGFQLPISFVVDSYTYYVNSTDDCSVLCAEKDLMDFSNRYISESMVAGEIKNVNMQTSMDDNMYRLDGVYYCLEMIGRTKAYEIGDVYGENS